MASKPRALLLARRMRPPRSRGGSASPARRSSKRGNSTRDVVEPLLLHAVPPARSSVQRVSSRAILACPCVSARRRAAAARSGTRRATTRSSVVPGVHRMEDVAGVGLEPATSALAPSRGMTPMRVPSSGSQPIGAAALLDVLEPERRRADHEDHVVPRRRRSRASSSRPGTSISSLRTSRPCASDHVVAEERRDRRRSRRSSISPVSGSIFGCAVIGPTSLPAEVVGARASRACADRARAAGPPSQSASSLPGVPDDVRVRGVAGRHVARRAGRCSPCRRARRRAPRRPRARAAKRAVRTQRLR